ncbi:MAG TPA: TolC family protein, partial [Terriglobales bacterium]|nr:TolC family protein [Terriglobales bacterium]
MNKFPRQLECGKTPHLRIAITRFSFLLLTLLPIIALAQAAPNLSLTAELPSAPTPQTATTPQPQAPPPGTSGSNAPLTLTLQDALQRARANNPQYQSALTDFGVAHQDLVQSRAALLPNATYNMQYLYTQGNGTTSNTPVFIANNGVHEYIAQGNVHQSLSPQTFAEYRRTAAAEAVARAKAEIASRGLVVTVVQSYYGFLVAQRKYATAQRAASEAQRFLNISQKLEKGGEVAHSDVLKAQIQYQSQQRDLEQANLEMNKSRLDLAILLFPDFNENFTIVDDLGPPEPLPTFEDVQTAGTRNNPDLRAALAAFREAGQEVRVAWAGLLPAITLDYFYGLDSNHLATETTVFDPSGRPISVSTLGNSASATLQLPLWTWGANISKVKQANLRRHQAQVELSFAQRELLANVRNFYHEAEVARAQLESLSLSAQMAAESLRLTN